MAHQIGNIWSSEARRAAGYPRPRSILSVDDDDDDEEEDEEQEYEELPVEELMERCRALKEHLAKPFLDVELIRT
ncbi:hypothetical protein HDV00_011270 [Rhizophlyctis rosea]|nr:hypothetical protein HDV00_011270 [Rhizophlyctis rosea]